jgi:hypothetical protein
VDLVAEAEVAHRQGNFGCPLVSRLMKMADSWSMPMPRQYSPSTPS